MKQTFTKISILISAAALFSSVSLFAQLNYDWTKQYDLGYNQLTGIGADAAGNYYVVGAYYDTIDVDFGPGETKLTPSNYTSTFVVKYTSNGTLVWGKKIGNFNCNAIPDEMKVDAAGNIYILGRTGTEIGDSLDMDPGAGQVLLTQENSSFRFAWVLKWTTDGNFGWIKTIRSANASNGVGVYGTGLGLDASGNVFVTGSWDNDVDFGAPLNVSLNSPISRYSAFLAKYDPTGNFQWAKGFIHDVNVSLSSNFCQFKNIHASSSEIILTGYFKGLVDFNPGAGVDTLSASSDNVIIVKLDNAGNYVYAKQMGGNNGDGYPNSSVTDAGGNIFLTGYFRGTQDFDPNVGVENLIASTTYGNIFVAKLLSNGNLGWAKSIGSDDDYQYGNDILLDATGNVWVTGEFGDTVDFNPGAGVNTLTSKGNTDAFLLSLDGNGNFLSANSWGGSSYDNVSAIIKDASGNVLLGGFYNSSDAELNPFARGFAAGNVYITKLTPDGVSVKDIAEQAKWTLYPNPAHDAFAVAGIEAGSVVTIIDLVGSVVSTTTAAEMNTTISTAGLSTGMYIVQVETNGKTSQKKMLISK